MLLFSYHGWQLGTVIWLRFNKNSTKEAQDRVDYWFCSRCWDRKLYACIGSLLYEKERSTCQRGYRYNIARLKIYGNFYYYYYYYLVFGTNICFKWKMKALSGSTKNYRYLVNVKYVVECHLKLLIWWKTFIQNKCRYLGEGFIWGSFWERTKSTIKTIFLESSYYWPWP